MTTANPSIATTSLSAKIVLLARDVKLSHSIFALPFALLSTFLAAEVTFHAPPKLGQLALIILCMLSARTLAMASNRLLDAGQDRINPRTARRAIPSGALSPTFVIAAIFVCALAFTGTTLLFGIVYRNWLPLILSSPVLLFIAAYPFLKRFTLLCHYYLGASLALAPVCAWIAIAGRLNVEPLLMAGAVLCWTAGFDIIYACQDYANDVANGVFSVPAKLGIARALWVSRATHFACIMLLWALHGYSPQLDTLFGWGIAFATAMLIGEHLLVRPNDLSKVGLAFFTINGIISVVLGTLGILDVFF